MELSGLLKQHGWCEAFSEVGAAQQSLVFLELYPLTAGNRKEWESRLLVGNVCIYSGPVRVRERERRKKKKRKEKKRKKKKPKETKGPLVETEVSSLQVFGDKAVEATL